MTDETATTGLTKVSVNFTPRAMRALGVSVEVTGYRQTDTLNRAIQIYAYLVKAEQDGKALCLEAPDGSREHVFFV